MDKSIDIKNARPQPVHWKVQSSCDCSDFHGCKRGVGRQRLQPRARSRPAARARARVRNESKTAEVPSSSSEEGSQHTKDLPAAVLASAFGRRSAPLAHQPASETRGIPESQSDRHPPPALTKSAPSRSCHLAAPPALNRPSV